MQRNVSILPLACLAALGWGAPDVEFVKTVVDTRFVAEGVAVGDVNRDGRLDILAGNVWYEAPGWTTHEIAPVAAIEPKTGYSNCFNSWAEDLNHDGWVDQILIGPPGEKAVWRENPKGGSGPWKEHLVWRSACNESPLYADLFKDGKRVLVMGTDDEYLAWFEPAEDPYAEWICHPVSGLKGAGSQRYSHGLGVGDVDGDGRNEILTTAGAYSGSREGPWVFAKAALGPECAQMLVFDGNGDGRPDVFSTSAHARGVWWFEQGAEGGFQRHLVDETISETHSVNLVQFGKTVNLITGKRKWAHPPGVDVGSEEPSLLVRYERGADGTWVRHVIDDASGVGTQFVAQDMNGDGLVDLVIANKNGVFLFEQKAAPW
ncbi:MAG: hypothetical protein M9921_14575 [Fimbriimonadaceae bacterium]|nr:VCBS repeat-containing protein [Chthonomonadaceae bacterium]MCO5298070.1 hypothetical protein [Fimbriimonadaceae bacterium]